MFLLFFMVCTSFFKSSFSQELFFIKKSDNLIPSHEIIILNSDEKEKLATLRSSRVIKNSMVGKANIQALKLKKIKIELPDGSIVDINREKDITYNPAGAIWLGKTQNGGEVIFSFTEKKFSGTIRENGKIYNIDSLSDNFQVIREIDSTKFPPEHPKEHPNGSMDGYKQPQIDISTPKQKSSVNRLNSTTSSTPVATISPNYAPINEIRILIAYTPRSAAYLVNIGEKINQAIALMNDSFDKSWVVGVHISLAATMQISDEYSSAAKALTAFRNMADVKRLRDQSNADAMVLIASLSDNVCGLSAAIKAAPTDAFAVVADYCFVDNYSMAHELGHLLGALHDPVSDPSKLPYDWAHGYWIRLQNGVCAHTIMSNSVVEANPSLKCNSDPRHNIWSNTNLVYQVGGSEIWLGASNKAQTNNLWSSYSSDFSKFHLTKISTPATNQTTPPITQSTFRKIISIINNILISDGL